MCEGPFDVGVATGLHLELLAEVDPVIGGLCAANEEVEAGDGGVDAHGAAVEIGAAGESEGAGRARDHAGSWCCLWVAADEK